MKTSGALEQDHGVWDNKDSQWPVGSLVKFLQRPLRGLAQLLSVTQLGGSLRGQGTR